MVKRYQAVVLIFLLLALINPASAEELRLPAALQAELLVKVAAYDRNLPKRAGSLALTIVLSKPHNADSAQGASLMKTALAKKTAIASIPHAVETAEYSGQAALASLCKAKKPAIIYIAPGFSDAEVGAIVTAIEGLDVLTVSGVVNHLDKGIVLGFDLVSGKPKIFFSMGQARKQGVSISADILTLMTVRQ